jgi:hypothetical protein
MQFYPLLRFLENVKPLKKTHGHHVLSETEKVLRLVKTYFWGDNSEYNSDSRVAYKVQNDLKDFFRRRFDPWVKRVKM